MLSPLRPRRRVFDSVSKNFPPFTLKPPHNLLEFSERDALAAAFQTVESRRGQTQLSRKLGKCLVAPFLSQECPQLLLERYAHSRRVQERLFRMWNNFIDTPGGNSYYSILVSLKKAIIRPRRPKLNPERPMIQRQQHNKSIHLSALRDWPRGLGATLRRRKPLSGFERIPPISSQAAANKSASLAVTHRGRSRESNTLT
jgi:hypothetical protein